MKTLAAVTLCNLLLSFPSWAGSSRVGSEPDLAPADHGPATPIKRTRVAAPDKTTIPQLIKQIDSEDSRLRVNAIDQLSRLEGGEEALKTKARELLDRLGSEKFQVREGATVRLKEMGPYVRSEIALGLKSEDREVAHRARELLRVLSIEWTEAAELITAAVQRTTQAEAFRNTLPDRLRKALKKEKIAEDASESDRAKIYAKVVSRLGYRPGQFAMPGEDNTVTATLDFTSEEGKRHRVLMFQGEDEVTTRLQLTPAQMFKETGSPTARTIGGKALTELPPFDFQTNPERVGGFGEGVRWDINRRIAKYLHDLYPDKAREIDEASFYIEAPIVPLPRGQGGGVP